MSTQKLSWACISNTFGSRKRMVIYASKLAALAGLNPYVDRAVLRREFHDMSFNPETQIKEAIQTLKGDSMDTFTRAIADIQNVTETGESVTIVVDAIKKLDTDMTITTECKEAIRSSLYTAHGIKGEAGIRDTISLHLGKIKTDARFMTSDLICRVGPYDVFLGGKHDGMMEDGTLTEIKNRMNRFLGAPMYEKIQLHAYMRIFGTEKTLLVENYKGSIQEHPINFDFTLWETVISNLVEFIDSLDA